MYLDYINQTYPIRRTKEEKKAFQNYVLETVKEAKVETTKDGKNENIVIGNPETAKVVCTAHYDTPMHSLFPNIMIPRNRAVFYLYQFAPVALVLALSLGPVFLVNAFYPLTRQEMVLGFLVLYYGLYFLMFRGKKNPNNYNDNTSGVALILGLQESLNPEQTGDVAFILFDNEGKGKKGSKAYFKDHKEAMESKFLINFDCVANGNQVLFAAMEKAEGTTEWKTLQEVFSTEEAKQAGFTTHFHSMKDTKANSDQKSFPCGVGCMAYKRTKKGLLYTPYIHTPKDVVADNKNIEFLKKQMERFFSNLTKDKL